MYELELNDLMYIAFSHIQTFVRWALYILFKFVKSLIRHLGLVIGNVRHVRWFSWTLYVWSKQNMSCCSVNSFNFVSQKKKKKKITRKIEGINRATKHVYPWVSSSRSPNDSNSNRQEWINISTKPNSPAYHWEGILHGEWYETRELKVIK